MNIEKSCRNCDRNHACHKWVEDNICLEWVATQEIKLLGEILERLHKLETKKQDETSWQYIPCPACDEKDKQIKDLQSNIGLLKAVREDDVREINKLKSKLYSNGQALKQRGENLMEDGKQ